MRQRKVVKIDDREITVKELTVQEILDILNDTESAGKDQVQDLKNLVEKHLVKATDASLDDFKGMAPSEIQQVFDIFFPAVDNQNNLWLICSFDGEGFSFFRLIPFVSPRRGKERCCMRCRRACLDD